MTEQSDSHLLRAYAERRLEAAFSELVGRHVDFVYSAAIRMVRDSHLAEDVTQGVFIALAKQASSLTERATLTGWLHRTAQNIAAQTVRTTERRRTREQEAVAMNELISASPEASWEQIAPHLDAALGELTETDRDAVLLRYFDNRSAVEMAGLLGISDEAAQKRVSRAVERLREVFARRGVTVGVGGLVAAISAHAVQAAPAGLAVTVSAAALAGATTTASTIVATTKPLLMTALQKTVITATLAVVTGAAIYQAVLNHRLQAQVEALHLNQTAPEMTSASNDLAALQNQLEQLSQQNAELTTRLAAANANSTRLSAAKQQAERSASMYRQLADQASAKNTSSTNDYPSLRHVFVGFGKLVRQMVELNQQDRSKLTPEEATASNQMKSALMRDFMSLASLAGQYEDTEKTSGDPSATDAADHAADTMTCLLYGAVGLSEQQYADVYGILQNFQRQAAEQNLFGDAASPEAIAALKQVNEAARRQIEPLLSGDQAKALEAIVPSVQLVTRKLNISFGSK